MYITWYGQSCFKIQGKDATIITDPYDSKIGLKLPRLNAEVVTVSHQHYDHNNVKAIGGNPFIITTPGEYEVRGISIRGISSWHDNNEGADRGNNIIHLIEFEEVRIAHLGDLGTTLTDEQLEQLGNVDILMIPVGGIYTLDAKAASDVVSKIEPRIVIPMHYKIPKLNIKLHAIDAFLNELGIKTNGAEEKLKISKKELPVEETKVIILQP